MRGTIEKNEVKPRTYRFPPKLQSYIERRLARKGYGSIQETVNDCIADALKHDPEEVEDNR